MHLSRDRDQEDPEKNRGAERVTELERHRKGVAAVSPSVVAQILINQKATVTSGTLLSMPGLSESR
jgi:hypothetical protein